MALYSNLRFFDKHGSPLNLEYDATNDIWTGEIQFDRVSVALYESEQIFVLERVLDGTFSLGSPQSFTGTEYKYTFPFLTTIPPGGGGTTADWGARWETDDDQEEIFLYDIGFEQAPNLSGLTVSTPFISTLLDAAVTVDLTDSFWSYVTSAAWTAGFVPGQEDGQGSPTGDTHSLLGVLPVADDTKLVTIGTAPEDYLGPLKFNIALTSTDEGIYERTLIIEDRSFATPRTVAEIHFWGETVGEDERFRLVLENFGRTLNQKDALIIKDYDINESLPDWQQINEKRKEMLLTGEEIFPYVGAYKGLINIIRFFGYQDLRVKEYWLNMDARGPNFGKYQQIEIDDVLNDGYIPALHHPLLPSKTWKKTSKFGLFYDITVATGDVDDFGTPTTMNDSMFTNEEVLIKLFALKDRLKRDFLPLNARIIDITGEGIYFEKYGINTWTDDLKIVPVDVNVKVGFISTPDVGYIRDLRRFQIKKFKSQLESSVTDIFDMDTPTGEFATGGFSAEVIIDTATNILYGVAPNGGGTYGLGVLFSFDPDTDTYTPLHEFSGISSTGGSNPTGIIALNNGVIYGTTVYGGTNNDGTIYMYDNGVHTVLYEFDVTGISGNKPVGGITMIGDIIYGIANNGGSGPFLEGTIFSYDFNASPNFSILHDFDTSVGDVALSFFSMTAVGQVLYGVGDSGGANSIGGIFRFDTVSNTYSVVYDFTTAGGYTASTSQMSRDGIMLYGVLQDGGASGWGVIFSFNTVTNIFTTMYEFDSTAGINGRQPISSILSDGVIYGCAITAGLTGYGLMFSYNIATSTYTRMANNYLVDGYSATAFADAGNGQFYGAFNLGGLNSFGSLFSFVVTNTNPLDLPVDRYSNTINPYAAAQQYPAGEVDALITAIEEYYAEMLVFTFPYTGEKLNYVVDQPEILAGCPVVLTADFSQFTWDDVRISWADINVGSYSWDSINFSNFYEIEWTIRKANPNPYYFRIRGKISDYWRLPHFLPFIGEYTVTMKLHDLFNSQSTDVQIGCIEVLPREVEVAAFCRYRNNEIYEWDSINDETWDDLGGSTWHFPTESNMLFGSPVTENIINWARYKNQEDMLVLNLDGTSYSELNYSDNPEIKNLGTIHPFWENYPLQWDEMYHTTWDMADYHGDFLGGFRFYEPAIGDSITVGDFDPFYFTGSSPSDLVLDLQEAVDQLNSSSNPGISLFYYVVRFQLNATPTLAFIHACARQPGPQGWQFISYTQDVPPNGIYGDTHSFIEPTWLNYTFDDFLAAHPTIDPPVTFLDVVSTPDLLSGSEFGDPSSPDTPLDGVDYWKHKGFTKTEDPSIDFPFGERRGHLPSWAGTGAFKSNDVRIYTQNFEVPLGVPVFFISNHSEIPGMHEWHWTVTNAETDAVLVDIKGKPFLIYKFLEESQYSIYCELIDSNGNSAYAERVGFVKASSKANFGAAAVI